MPRIRAAALLLLSPLILASDSVEGVWRNEESRADLTVEQTVQGFSFHYVNEGKYRCEVPGLAKPLGGGKYEFRNSKEYFSLEGYEGYAFPDQPSDCSIIFTFEADTVIVKHTGDCRSFCGLSGDIDDKLTRARSSQ